MAETDLGTGSLNGWTAGLVVDTCIAAGVDHFFLAPGSRCTPLTEAIAQRREARVVQHFDERGLAFACLGYGRATGRPGVFVCTSGTAVANALPAVVEAAAEQIPLLLLTSDRPPELRDAGANQAIDQVKLFGGYVAWFFDLPCPSSELPAGFWISTVQHAVRSSASGPVHLNWMFREPFGPPSDARVPQPPPSVVVRETHHYDITLPPGRTLVMAGACRTADAVAASSLAQRLGCPFLSDITNGVRGLPHDLLLMRDDLPAPEIIVHVGGRVVSKRWLQALARWQPEVCVQYWPHGSRQNPLHLPLQVIVGKPSELCAGTRQSSPPDDGFRRAWQDAARDVELTVNRFLEEEATLSEPAIALQVLRLLPPDHGLFLGNSMPIRDFDLLRSAAARDPLDVAANRGASGIDGLIGSAVGFGIGLQRPVTAVIGDLSALHDLNSLSLLAKSPCPLVLIIINNNGGGIFHFLPVAETSRHFESHFATPHGWGFAEACAMFGLPWSSPTNSDEFGAAYRQAAQNGRSAVLEIVTDRRANRELHRRLGAAIRSGGS